MKNILYLSWLIGGSFLFALATYKCVVIGRKQADHHRQEGVAQFVRDGNCRMSRRVPEEELFNSNTGKFIHQKAGTLYYCRKAELGEVFIADDEIQP